MNTLSLDSHGSRGRALAFTSIGKFASLGLALFLQLAPFATRTFQAEPTLGAAPAVIVLRWVVGALAVAGTFHAVSAASAALASKSTIQGTVGTRLSYQIKISDGKTRQPGSWVVAGKTLSDSGSTTSGMPPGLTLSLATGIISGVPTQGGSFPIPITAYEDANLRGHQLSFTLTFNIAGGTTPPTITTAPVSLTVHTGELISLGVVAGGTGPFTYLWRQNGTDLPDQTNATLTVAAAAPSDAGDYVVVITGAGGTVTSSPATVTVVPISMSILFANGSGATLRLQTINGRSYVVEAADALSGAVWQPVGRVTGNGSATVFIGSLTDKTQRFWRYHPTL